MELDRRLAELRELNRRDVATVKETTCKGPECAESRLGLPLLPGARVFDTVTGKEGSIIAGRTEGFFV